MNLRSKFLLIFLIVFSAFEITKTNANNSGQHHHLRQKLQTKNANGVEGNRTEEDKGTKAIKALNQSQCDSINQCNETHSNFVSSPDLLSKTQSKPKAKNPEIKVRASTKKLVVTKKYHKPQTHNLLEPRPTFDDQVEEESWPPSAFKDYSVSYLSLYRLITLEHDIYLFLKNDVFRFSFDWDWNPDLRRQVKDYIHYYEKEVLTSIERWTNATGTKMSIYATLEHPFLIEMMLRRCVFEFMPLYTLLQKEREGRFYDDIPPEEWPTEADMKEYTLLVNNLQLVHDFNLTTFVIGEFDKIKTEVILDVVHTLKSGDVALGSGFYFSAVQWMKQAYDMASEASYLRLTKQGHYMMKLCTKHLSDALQKHDNKWTPDYHNNFLVFRTKVADKVENITHKFIAQSKYRGCREFNQSINYFNFMTLCKGTDNWQTLEERSLLHCYYDHTIAILSFKVEILSSDPVLLQVHDFISRKMSNEFIRRSFKHLHRRRLNLNHLDLGTKRNDTLATLPVSQMDYTIDKKIKLVTKLRIGPNKIDDEGYEVTTSIPGGFVNNHFDTTEDTLEVRSKRLATVFIYLNKVQHGGRIVFPLLGLSVKPKARSALFWFNFLKNGSLDHRLYHGECPVVLGRKWTATKYIGENFSGAVTKALKN